jgi:hypothetical protein
LLFREDVHATVIHSAKVEEKTILEAFRKLQKFRMSQININSPLRENNLKKSLQNYSSAMEEESMVLKFRDLFTGLEVCTNIDGIERKDATFDKQVSNLSGTNPNTVNRWRLFYNRIKHADRRQKDIDIIYNSERDLPEQPMTLRNVVRGILLTKLN